jgi:phosphoribosylglycinamide formyltransferase 1
MKNLGILLSGRGSNFVAIADSIAAGRIPDARISVVISNRADAPGLEIARQRGLNALVIPSKGKPREEHDREVVAALLDNKVDLVCLAGYMRLLSPWFVQQFPAKILNIHPSLLPAFPGLEAQQQAFAYGVKCQAARCIWWMRNSITAPSSCRKPYPCSTPTTSTRLRHAFSSRNTSHTTEAIKIVLEGKFEIVGRRMVKGQR